MDETGILVLKCNILLEIYISLCKTEYFILF